MPFEKGKAANPTGAGGEKGGRPKGSKSQPRSPVLVAMERLIAGEEPRTEYERRLKEEWYDEDIEAFTKEYNRLLAVEKGKAGNIPAPTEGEGVEALDPGVQKAKALLEELIEGFYQKHPEYRK